MKLFLRIILLSFLLVFVLLLHSENLIRYSDTLIIRYQSDTSMGLGYGSRMIADLAQETGTPVRKCTIVLHYSLTFNQNEGTMKCSINKVSGFVSYRQFDMGRLMIPSVIRATIRLRQETTNDEIEYIIPLIGNGDAELSGVFSMPEAYEVQRIQLVNGGYSQTVFEQFRATLMAIRDYHAAVEVLISGLKLIDTAIQLLPDAKAHYYYAEAFRAGAFIKQMDVFKNIKLSQDPSGLMKNLNALDIALYRFRLGAARDRATAISPVYPSQPEKLAMLCNAWIQHPSYFKPSDNGLFTRLASLDSVCSWQFYPGVFFEDSLPDSSMAIRIAAHFFRLSEQYASQGRMAEARIQASNALFMVKGTNRDSLIEDYQRNLSSIIHGILEAYLSVSQKAVSVGNIRLAGQYLYKAHEFRRLQSSFLISDILLKPAAEAFANACLDQGKSFFDASMHEKAIVYFSKLEPYLPILNEWSRKTNWELLLREAHQKKYEEMLMDAVIALRENKSVFGAERFETTLAYRKFYHLQKRNEEDEALQRIFKSRLLNRFENIPAFISDSAFLQSRKILLQTIDSVNYANLSGDSVVMDCQEFHIRRIVNNCYSIASSMYWDDNPEAMQHWMKNGKLLADDLGYGQDSLLSEVYDHLQLKIPLLTCKIMRQEVFVLNTRALSAFEQENWIAASGFANEMLLKARSLNTCYTDTLKVSELLKLNAPLIHYHQLLEQAGVYYIKRESDSLMRFFQQVQGFYVKYQLNEKHIQNPTDEHLLFLFPDIKFAQLLLNQYIKNADWKRALNCLDTLRRRGVQEETARLLLTDLGQAWGASVIVDDKDRWFAENLPAYEWYAAFRKSFEKENRKLKNKTLIDKIPFLP